MNSARQIFQYFLISGVLILLTRGCLDPYPLPDVSEGLLVVDGRFTDQVSENRVLLSFAGQVNDGGTPIEDASVYIRDDQGGILDLQHTGMGVYRPEGDSIPGIDGRSYVLHIRLSDGRSYLSDICLFTKVPPIEDMCIDLAEHPADNNIDMIKGVDVKLSTHDPENRVQNYLWYFEETWEVQIPFPVREEYVSGNKDNAVFDYVNSSYRCFLNAFSEDINIKTTREQKEARIEDYPVTFISSETSRLWKNYRIKVYQFGLDDDAWRYHNQLKEITSQNGSVFDRQPFSLRGNVRNVDDKDEVVMGYFLVSGISTRTLDLSNWDIPMEYRGDFPLYFNCVQRADTFALSRRTDIANVINNYAPSVNRIFVSSVWYIPDFGDEELIGLLLVPIECATCEGSTVKPEYWP